jgi:Pentapeptide repeats (8 copies)
MAEGKGTPTPKEEKETRKRTWQREPRKCPPWWKRLWARTGFGDKTLWDLLQLFIVPVVLVGIGLLFEMQQAEREERRAEAERKLAEQRAQDEALQAYPDQMSTLMLEKDLRNSEEDSEVRTLARARTLTVIRRVDTSRKGEIMQFLWEADLVHRVGGSAPVIDLGGADLSGANLGFAFLSFADLREADLSRADLSWAKGVNNEELDQQAYSLEGATMPNGQKYEDWLKSKNRKEDG